MSRTKYELRRARQPHRCTECSIEIAVGRVYLFTGMPPEHEINDTRHWRCQKVCLRCVEREAWTMPQPRASKVVT